MFVSSWRHSCSSVPSSAGPYNPKPALLISTSMRPCVDTVAATTASTSVGTVTSSRAGWIRPSKPATTAGAVPARVADRRHDGVAAAGDQAGGRGGAEAAGGPRDEDDLGIHVRPDARQDQGAPSL